MQKCLYFVYPLWIYYPDLICLFIPLFIFFVQPFGLLCTYLYQLYKYKCSCIKIALIIFMLSQIGFVELHENTKGQNIAISTGTWLVRSSRSLKVYQSSSIALSHCSVTLSGRTNDVNIVVWVSILGDRHGYL